MGWGAGDNSRDFLRLLFLVGVLFFLLALTGVFFGGGEGLGMLSEMYDVMLMYPYTLGCEFNKYLWCADFSYFDNFSKMLKISNKDDYR